MWTATVVQAATKGKPRAPRTTEKAGLMDGVDEAMPHGQDLALIRTSLQTMRNGDFTVRLRVAWTQLKGKDLTDYVNVMAVNLAEQVRGIVKVVTAVANGELTQKLTMNAKSEVAALATCLRRPC